MAFTRVATLADVPPGKTRQVVVAGKTIGLFNVGGTIHALADSCPHRGAALTEGEIEGTEIICPWHDARFDLRTGAHLCPPASSGVTVYVVQVEGDEIRIEV